MSEVYMLVILICAPGNPTDCVEKPLPMQMDDYSVCMSRGLPVGRSLVSHFPGWTLGGWRCQATEARQ